MVTCAGNLDPYRKYGTRPGVPSQWIREKDAGRLLLCGIYPSHLPLRSTKDNIHPLNLVSGSFLVTS